MVKESVSLYFHIPFCTRKCPYCHFYVLPDKSDLKTLLREGLEREWDQHSHKFEEKEIVSIYFGGGTPTLFPPQNIARLLEKIPYSESCEITLEGNPENITTALMKEFAACGINRVSLGVQSLDNHSLNSLERRHSAEQAIEAIEETRKARIENISIDLMYELPGQTLSSWERTLKRVETLPITHLSLYNLTFEPQTLFFKRRKELIPLLPAPEASLEMLSLAVASLEKRGLKRYEVSAFARPGFESRHNMGYWTARPFLGLGPSAFSYWEQERMRNCADLKKYVEALRSGSSPIDFREKLIFPDNLHELLAVELRLLQGVNLECFQAKHGALPASTLEKLSLLHEKGLLLYNPSHVSLSPQGLLFYDTVASEII